MEFAPEGPMAIPLWINGHPYLTVGDRLFDVINPQTGEARHRVPLCGADEASEALGAARAAADAWVAAGEAARRDCLQRLADGLERYAGHFAKLLVQESGRDQASVEAEVADAVATLRTASAGEGGTIAVVIGTERPLAGLAAALAPAVLGGATVVVKPSPQAPAAAFALCELSARCAWPAGVLNLVHGDGPVIEGLCQAGAERLLFSGDKALREKVAELAAAHATPFMAVA